MNPDDMTPLDLNRRDFLKGGSAATLMSLLGAVELNAQNTADNAAPTAEPRFTMNCAVIGLGRWGREELLANLQRQPQAEVVAICDTYGAYLRRSGRKAPDAAQVTDYREILANKDIEAVFIATPSHLHREIAVESLKAGKHVYCEAPLATHDDDARAIAKAAHAAVRSNFQPGLQRRSDPQRAFLLPFIRSGAMGTQVKVRAQWHKKSSWRGVSPNPEQEKDLNWRLHHATSGGLVSEEGIHEIDAMTWFLDKQPHAVTGFGSIVKWNDGREVDDTIQAVLEFPGGINGSFEASLATSFDSEYEMYYGTQGTVMVRGTRAWMFKEADSPMLGWEVYARKDTFYKETGIVLIANATKQDTVTKKDLAEETVEDAPVYKAIEAFLYNSHLTRTGVADFISTFGEDDDALREYLADIEKDRLPAATYLDGFRATILALRANDAIKQRQRLVLQKEWFEV